jgi:xylulokinase
VASAARAAAGSGAAIEGVGLSCLTPALVLLDGADLPVAPIWTHLDRRPRAVARKTWADVGAEFLQTTGNRPLPGGISVTSWAQQLETDGRLAIKVQSYLHANGWLGLRLTGEKAIDPGNACFTGLFGTLTDQAWSNRWCRYFQVERNWLPRVMDGRDVLGSLRAEAAGEMGLHPGIPVKLGTADTSSAMLAAGMEPGDLLHVVGTTQVLAAFAPKPVASACRLTRRLGVGPAFIHVTHNPVGGVALDWIHKLCFKDQDRSTFFARTVPAAMNHPSAVVLEPPFLGGDRLEIEAQRAAFGELTLGTDRLDLLAALLRAMQEKHRQALADLGVPAQFKRVFLTGGGADVVRQLLSEYQGGQVHALEEGSLRGVARLFSSPAS